MTPKSTASARSVRVGILLTTQMQETLRWSSSLMKARSDGNVQGAQDKITTVRGYELTKNFRALVEEMRNEELSLLMVRTKAADNVRRRTLIAIAASTAMSLVLLPFFGWPCAAKCHEG